MRSSITSLAILALAASAAAQSTFWVNPTTGNDGNTGTFASPVKTINHANALANPGDILRLQAGTYGDEQGIIILGDKSVSVVGAGIGATILRAHSSITTNVNTGFPGSPVATQQRPVVLVQGSGTVDLRGMTIDGNFAMPATGRLSGVYYRNGADGLVSDVDIINCRAAALDGSQGPAGVVVRGDNLGDPCLVTLRNCTVRDWGKVGIAAFFNSTVTVEDSRVVGADHVQFAAAQNGIQIAYNASGIVRRTSIADVYYDPSNYVAAGILAYDADNTVIVEDCSIANCEHAIYFYGIANTTLSGEVRRNRVVACDAGVYVDQVSGLTIDDNHLQLSLDLFANAGYSNVGGNVWSNNNYSSYIGAGTYTVSGPGAEVDATPRRGVDLFDAPTTTALPAGHSGRHLAVAQLDGTGLSDFATVDENSGVSVSVGLNSGGSFVVTNFAVAASGRAVGIVAAELNNAPGLDLAVLTQVTTPTAGAHVFTLANNGSGSFSVIGDHFISGAQASALAAGDLDGDTVADLVVASVGSFGAGTAIKLANSLPYGTNYNQGVVPNFGYYTRPVRGVAIADVTGDGFRDVLVTEGDSSTGFLHVLANDGLGNLSPTGYSPLFVSNDPTSVASGDLDGDGDNDILVSVGTVVNSTNGGVTVLENLAPGFRRSNYNTDYSTNSVVIGNVDNDSDPDSVFGDAAVVNTDGGTVSLLGAFVRGVGFGAGGIVANGTQPTAAAFGDYDGDNFLDLFYTNGVFGQVVVLPGRPSARTDYYGFGTEGYRGRIPHIAPIGTPGVATQPNASLAIEVSNARPFTLGGIIVSLAPAPVLLPNDLQVMPFGFTLSTFFAVTSFEGKFTMPFALPASPSIHGFPLYFQAGVLDLVGNYVLYPGVSLSKGMKLRVGY